MATLMTFLANFVDATVPYGTTPADYLIADLVHDFLIWTNGSTVVTDLMTHTPTASELNAAAAIIDTVNPVTIPLCLFYDYSHNIGGSYYTHKVIGMSENKRYVFGFSFDGATATEPQLEAWDDATHTTAIKNVLGVGTPANSMVKAVCTTYALPGGGWAGVSLAGASNVLLLNGGLGAISFAGELYSNIKIVLPANYSTPAAETFTITARYSYV